MLKISIYIYWHKCSRFVLPTDERTKVFQEVLADLKVGSDNILLLEFSFPFVRLSPFFTCIIYSHNDGEGHTA